LRRSWSWKSYSVVPIPEKTYFNPQVAKGEEDCVINVEWYITILDSLCGVVVRVPGYRSRGQGSIPGATRFSEK
jgi:hypothetical protein